MKTIEVPVEILISALTAMRFNLNPYLDYVETEEECTTFREDYPHIADLCDSYDKLLMQLPEEIRIENDFEFIGL